jgi:hypothetical protein
MEMAKRSRQTPLYEFMAGQSESVRRAQERQQRAPGEESYAPPAEDFSLQAGRSIRLPVGAVLLAVAVAIILIIAAYIVGSWRAGAVARAEYEQKMLDASRGLTGSGGLASDPLVAPETPGSTVQERQPDPAPVVETPAETDLGGDWGPIESDPRAPGLHYLILAETRSDGAVRLAAFCRDQGLAAYVVSGNNDRFRRVIALPGFPTRSSSTPEARALLGEIHRIGALWKAREPGGSDLTDAYFPP